MVSVFAKKSAPECRQDLTLFFEQKALCAQYLLPEDRKYRRVLTQQLTHRHDPVRMRTLELHELALGPVGIAHHQDQSAD